MTQTKPTVTSSLTGKWKPYPAYKDSGVEWLGEVPAHWEAKRVRDITELLQTGPFGSQLHSSEYSHDGIPVINPSHLRDGHVYPDWDCTVDKETHLRLIRHELHKGDIVFARRGEMGRCALITEKEAGWLCGTGSLLMRPRVSLSAPSFLSKVLATGGVRDWLLLESVGSTMDNLNTNILSRIPLPIPPLPEQYTIATYLDRETARINALIAKKERLIELLQEKRAALISHAVTKGLDPTVPMKDSGVEWLGEIPAHWEVKRLKFCLESIEQGWSPTCENRLAEFDEWGVLKVGCVNGIKFNADENKALPAETQPISELEIKPGDVLVSRANTRELLGSASVVTQVRPRLLLCDKLYRLKIFAGTVIPIYLVLVMGASIIRYQLEREATGASSSMQNISQGTILNLVVPLPNTAEQHTIATYLDAETAKIDALISRIHEGIEKLKEYSAALISAAVTGKIDVREEIPSPGDRDL